MSTLFEVIALILAAAFAMGQGAWFVPGAVFALILARYMPPRAA